MKLADKGPLAPPPVLGPLLEPIAQTLHNWPGIIAAAHWDLFRVGEVVDGTDFYVDDAELGHIHHNGEVHMATSPALGQALVAASLARPLRWGGAAYRGWTEFSVHNPTDAAHATWLFELNYQRLRGQPEAQLIAAIADYPSIRQPESHQAN